MKSPTKPEPIAPEELLRRDRITELLRSAVGGYHSESVANRTRCSLSQAQAALKALDALGIVEQYSSFAGAKLWRLKQEGRVGR